MTKNSAALPTLRRSRGAQQNDLTENKDTREVFRLLLNRSIGTRTEVERPSMLSPSRFRAAVTLLLRNGLLVSPHQDGQDAAQRPVHPHANAGYGHVIGVDIGGSNLRIALADMSGTILGKWSASTKQTSSPSMVIAQIREGLSEILRATSVPRSSLQAIAVGAPGITNATKGEVLATSYLRGWTDVPLRSLLESALHIPVAVENDVRMAAIGENWMGAARGIENFAFLAIGTGIAAGIFINGKLLHGSDWAAGEVGYMLVPGTPQVAAKRSMPGSLESIIGGEGIKLQWQRSVNGKRVRQLQVLAATEIFDRAHAGDRLAKRVLETSAHLLAYAVYNISLVLNCSLFVLGGGVGMSKPLFNATKNVLARFKEPSVPKLALSKLGPDAQLMGAIRLALDKSESHIGLKI
jgi:glucokinase